MVSLHSPLYMSPEQAMGNRVDARSDIYAFGCVMYEALYGKPPFQAENPIRTIMKHIGQAPVPISADEVGQSIPDGLKYIIFHCLEKEPLDRYQSMHYLKYDLILESEHKSIYQYHKTFVSKDDELRAAQRVLAQKNLELNILKRQTGIRYRLSSSEVGSVAFFSTCVITALVCFSFQPKITYEQTIPALESNVQALRISHGHDSYFASELLHLARKYEGLEQFEKALPYFKEAWEIYREQPDRNEVSMKECTLYYAIRLRKLHRYAEAEQILSSWPIK